MDYNCDHIPIFTTISVAHKVKKRQFRRHVNWKDAALVSHLNSSLGAPGAATIMHSGSLPEIQTLFQQVLRGAPNSMTKAVVDKYPLELRNSFAALQESGDDGVLSAQDRVKMAREHYRLKRAWVNSERIKKLSHMDLSSICKGKKKHQAGPKSLICKGVETIDRGAWQNEISDNFAALYHDDSIKNGLVIPPVREEIIRQQTSRLAKIRELATNATQTFDVPLWLVLECRARFASKSATAPGADSITWEFLAALPVETIEGLRKAFQHRLNDTAVVK